MPLIPALMLMCLQQYPVKGDLIGNVSIKLQFNNGERRKRRERKKRERKRERETETKRDRQRERERERERESTRGPEKKEEQGERWLNLIEVSRVQSNECFRTQVDESFEVHAHQFEIFACVVLETNDIKNVTGVE